MARSKAFRADRAPLQDSPHLRLNQDRVSGPIPFLDPTRAHFDHPARPDVSFGWTSRNNRKGRHLLLVDKASPPATGASHSTPGPTSSPHAIAHSLWRMLTYYPVWDISFDVAFIFTIGSVIWVINAFFVMLPLLRPASEFEGGELYGGGITAFIGAMVFEIGSVLLMLEALNENRSGCFGWALDHALSHDKVGEDEEGTLRPSAAHCTHHHPNKRNLVGKSESGTTTTHSQLDTDSEGRSWIWWPSRHDLRTHYLRSLGFLASLSQLLGATIFWVAGLTSLPGIYNRMSHSMILVFYWTPQVVGGLGFIISGTLFMIETESKWWKPAPRTLGWWIGAWNLVGGVGFTLCPAFGYDTRSWAQYQACLSTFWGSWAFLIGSVIQCYESLHKFPVERMGESKKK